MINAPAGINQLIESLSSDDEVRREAAIARLAISGARAVEGLRRAYAAAVDPETKIAILRALEPSGDRRTLAIARAAIAEGGDVGAAGAAALRGLLDSTDASTGAEALDVIIAAALDPSADRRVRLAAFDALQGMPEPVRARVAEALETDPGNRRTGGAADLSRDAAATDAVWRDALEGRLTDTPGPLREAAPTKTAVAGLSDLQKLIDAVRTREGSEKVAARRDEWRRLRGTLHQALALRGSRLAVYDLRETLEDSRDALPASFLAALHVVGDQSCLEPLAAAYARTPVGDARWRLQLAAAFRAIARREKITRRHAVVKRIAARWPEAGQDLTAPG